MVNPIPQMATSFNTCGAAMPLNLDTYDVTFSVIDANNTFDKPGATCSGNVITSGIDAWLEISVPFQENGEFVIPYYNSGLSPVPDIAIAVYTGCGDLGGNDFGCVDDPTQVGGTNVQGIELISYSLLFAGEGFFIRIINKTPAIANNGILSFYIDKEITYEDAAATFTNNGTSWENAYTQLQDALTAEGFCWGVNEIWITEGTYYPDEGVGQTDNNRNATFQLRNNVALYGGFNSTETTLAQHNWENNLTILSGDLTDNSYSVVTGSGTNATAVMDGFTMTWENWDVTSALFTNPNSSVGGIFKIGSSPTFTNRIFSGNSATRGSGMYNLNNSSLTVTNNNISKIWLKYFRFVPVEWLWRKQVYY